MRRLNWVLEIVLQCIIFALCIQSEISNVVIPVKTDFSCLNKTAGFYADTGASCKIYHTCDEYGNKFTYHCPEETAFRQDALICDHAHLVRCHGHTIYNSKYIEEKNKNSSLNVSPIKDLVEKSQNVFHVTQSLKATNKVRYGFTISTKEYFGNMNKPQVAEPNITNFHTTNDTSFTATLPINSFMKTTLQHVSSANNTQERGSIKNDNFSTQKQFFNSWDKLNEKNRTNQKDYVNRKTNDASYDFVKFSVNVFPGNAQNQEDNAKNYQTIKNITNLSKLPFTNHRNYPYSETLKSVQKNTQISATTNSIKPEHTLVVTTELPVYALTLSLKPLIPSELEYDPYYPKLSTPTESYYIPAHSKELSYMKDPVQATWSSIHFELPPILPDLNSLEDIVDRRKLFYIPRITSN